MRVGVVILPEYSASEMRARYRALQNWGFAHVWSYDHLAWRSLADSDWYSTVPMLTLAAMSTDTLRIGTWVTSPNFRHPVPFTKDLMTLDAVSGGRIIAAMGAGGLGIDAEVLGQPALSARQRVDRFVEFVELTDRLLRQRRVDFQGHYYSAVGARTVPAGSRTRIPVVVAGSGPRSTRFAAGYDGWATNGPSGGEVGPGFGFGVADRPVLPAPGVPVHSRWPFPVSTGHRMPTTMVFGQRTAGGSRRGRRPDNGYERLRGEAQPAGSPMVRRFGGGISRWKLPAARRMCCDAPSRTTAPCPGSRTSTCRDASSITDAA